VDTKTFNDYMIKWAAQRVVDEGYTDTVEKATEWLSQRKSPPRFMPANSSFKARGVVMTLERVCAHAYEIIVARRRGDEAELPARVKAYYTPRFEDWAAGKSFW
jgi:hypothetical protein